MKDANALIATDVQKPAGSSVSQEQESFNRAQSLIDTRNAMLTLAATPPPPNTSGMTLLARGLMQAIQANSSYIADLNLLYGTKMTAKGPSTAADVAALSNIAVQKGYNQSIYLSRLRRTAGLYRALQRSTTARLNFNKRYGVAVPATGVPPQTARWKVFESTNVTGYNQDTFIRALGGTPTPSVPVKPPAGSTNPYMTSLPSPARSLAQAILSRAGAKENINLLYGTKLNANGPSSTADGNVLKTITVQSGYNQYAYLSRLEKAANLYRALMSDAKARGAFNTRYSVSVPASGTPPAASRSKLFVVVGTANYQQAAFLKSLVGTAVPPKPSTPTTPASPGKLFAPNSVWNAKLGSSTAVHPNSGNLVNELVRNTKLAPIWINGNTFSTPLYIVDANTPRVPVSIVQNGVTMSGTALHQRLQKGVPLPAGVKAASGTDGHLTILDVSTDTLYEFWLFKNVNGRWQSTWGGVLEHASTSNGTMPVVTNQWGGKEYWGATATGLPAIAGTIMLKELQSGVIPHALAFAIPQPKQGTFVAPATRTDGFYTGANAIPEGTRFRFPSNIAIDPNWSPMMKMMVTAVRDYGMVLRDVAGAAVFYAEDRTRFGSGDPYTAFYGGKPLWDVMKEFPWQKLMAVV